MTITLRALASVMLENARKLALDATEPDDLIFSLPTANGANKDLLDWVRSAEIEKHVTWSSARLSFSILLQKQRVDDATVAYLMGHTTTKQVQTIYKRHRPNNQEAVVSLLPGTIDIMI